ncbi:MAG: glycosyltransferase [Gammaproteobacteria bacterium]|nr:glycosyltransferase [Gammaproteobacteria bacterium]
MKTVTNFSSGGTEGQVQNLIKVLDHDRIDLQFSCLKKYGLFLEEVERAKIPVREFPISSFFHPGTWWQLCKMAAFMRSQRIQISHSYNFYSNLLAVPAAKLAGVPVVLASIRDRGIYLTPMQKKVQKWICNLADRVLVNADSIRTWLIDQGVPDQKITLIKNGINLSLYESRVATDNIRVELGIPLDSRLVIMLARLNPQKGIDDFLRAAALIRDNHPDVHFLVVGDKLDYKDGAVVSDANYHNYLHQLTLTLGISHCTWFTGHRTDVPALLAQSCVSVLPSHSEGLSNSLIESMAAGLPLVATDVGGNPELVIPGINGILVPVLDFEVLAGAINTILDDPLMASRFGTASRRLCEEQFSMQKMAEATQFIYVSELEKRGLRYITGKAH